VKKKSLNWALDDLKRDRLAENAADPIPAVFLVWLFIRALHVINRQTGGVCQIILYLVYHMGSQRDKEE